MSTDNAGGELSLAKLLSTLTATLHPSTFVFATVPPSRRLPVALDDIRMLFRESEGITLIISLETARSHALEFQYECRMITLDVHSSLEAIGFMATVATRLAGEGISVNPVSGFYHDHLFVPAGKEEETMRLLRELARSNSGHLQ